MEYLGMAAGSHAGDRPRHHSLAVVHRPNNWTLAIQC